MSEKDEPNEITSEEAERFRALVFSPETEKIPFCNTQTVSTIHSGNVLSIIPWTSNSNYVFSTDVTKRLVCFSLDDLSIISEVYLSAPCCSLALICDAHFLIAGCMDGTIHTYRIDADRFIVKKLEVYAHGLVYV